MSFYYVVSFVLRFGILKKWVGLIFMYYVYYKVRRYCIEINIRVGRKLWKYLMFLFYLIGNGILELRFV